MRSRLDPWRFRTPRLTLRHRIPKRNDRGTEKSSRRMPLRSVRIQLGVGLGKGLEAMPDLMDLERIRRLLGGVIGRGLSESRARPSLSLSFGMFYCQESPAQSLTLAVIVHNQHASVLRLHSRTQIHFTDAHQDSLESPLEELVHTSRA